MPRPDARTLASLAPLFARALRAGRPRPITTESRLANIPVAGAPLRAPVAIAWDEHQIPSIEAESTHDLAVALGVVHAHLRLAQMETMRRLATGRVAEVAGPLALPLDHALLSMDFARAVPGIIAMMPAATRDWAEAFVAGVNHHIAHAPALPHEFALLDIRPRPWTLHDLLAVGRLAAADVSWLVFARLLRGERALSPAAWDALWPLLQSGDTLPVPDGSGERALAFFRGSNSAAVPASRAASGAGMIASDPHLSIMSPPLFLIAALHAPGLDAVGLMIPGIPLVALGRTHALAWGGTSLHAASSELIDVADETVTERRVRVPVRGQRDAEVTLRETRFGPVVSDGMLLRADRTLALRWVGHRASDEMTAMLGALQARDFDDFRAALRGFAIPGQTMVAVEAGPHGRAGRVIAAHLPRRPNAPMPSLVCAPAQAWDLDDLLDGTGTFTVGDDVVASANDRPDPAAMATPAPAGFFYSVPVRARRLRALLDRAAPVTRAQMQAVQRDVYNPSALALRDALLARLPLLRATERRAARALAAWDGCYDANSAGALVFEAMVGALARRVIPPPLLDVLGAIWSGRAIAARELAAADPAMIRAALVEAARMLRRYRVWGRAHRLAPEHALARLPLLGRRYARRALPSPGGNDTLDKTGHALFAGRHRVTFGACARHVSDMADPDANFFVLLGGQDGWLGSANEADQWALWREGRMITVPLRAEAARAWPHRTVLRPR
jgi:penicillin amidase